MTKELGIPSLAVTNPDPDPDPDVEAEMVPEPVVERTLDARATLPGPRPDLEFELDLLTCKKRARGRAKSQIVNT